MAALLFGSGVTDAVATDGTSAVDPGGWVTGLVRKFRSYPHLERAYRLAGEQRLSEARHEFEAYLAIEPLAANPWVSYAALLYQLQEYQAAVAAAERAHKLAPDSAPGVLTRAMSLQALGHFEEASRAFAQLMKRVDLDQRARLFSASSRVYLALLAESGAEALEALSIAAELESSIVEARLFHEQRARALHMLGDLDAADRAYYQAIALEPDAAERMRLLSIRGDLASERKDYATRRASFTEALQLDPSNHRLQRAMADIDAAEGRRNDAIAWLRLAVEGGSADDRLFLAELLAQEGRFDEAIAHFTWLIANEAQEEQRARLLLSRGHTFYAQARYEAASADFEAAAMLGAAGAQRSLVYALEQAGDEQALLAALEKLTAVDKDANLLLRQADLLLQQDRSQEAVVLLEHALQPAVQIEASAPLHARLGALLAASGRKAAALRHLDEAHALGADPDTNLLRAQLLVETGDDEAAAQGYRDVLAQPLDDAQRFLAWQELARLHVRAGRLESAVDAYRRALSGGADHNPQLEGELAHLLSRMGDHELALGHFMRVASVRPTAAALLDVATTLQALGRSAEALSYFSQALVDGERLSASQRKFALDSAGELQAARGDRRAAVALWRRSLEESSDAALAIRLASLYLHLGEAAPAAQLLETIDPASLPRGTTVGFWEQKAELHHTRAEFAQAIDALRQAQRIAPQANHSYRIGLYCQQAGDAVQSIVEFERAVALAPDSALYRETLAYAYQATGRGTDAIALLEPLHATQPERSDLGQNLAYGYLQAGDERAAARAFRQAIDSRLASIDGDSARQPPGFDAELNRMRQEVAALERRSDLTLYYAYRDHDGGRGDVGRGLIPSQGGAEYSYRLPTPGIGHSIEFFGRVLWGAEPGEVGMESDSLQGGAGIRFRPLAAHNFYLSAERLVRVGDEARNDWLLRASYGWSPGYALRPGERSWNYTSLYLDAGYFTDDGGLAAYYGELRQGWTFNVGDRLLITPHLLVSGRHLNPDDYDDAYREMGAGLSVRFLFNQSRYAAARSSAEVLLQYKEGFGPNDNGGGWVITTVVRF